MKLGEEILKCASPFAYVVNQNLSETVCDNCLRRRTNDAGGGGGDDGPAPVLLKCSGCKHVRYCGTSCQRKAWSAHRDECAYLKRVFPRVPSDTVRLLARLIMRLRNGGAKETVVLPDGSSRRFDDLLDHKKQLVRDTKRMAAFKSFFAVLQDCFDAADLPPADQVLEIFGRVLINSFNIMDDEYQPLGIGLYLAASSLDHSCAPNAAVVFDGKSLAVRAIVETKEAVPFNGVRISYTNLLNATAERRRDLRDQYYFDCDCKACKQDPFGLDPLKSGCLRCSGCRAAVPIAPPEDSAAVPIAPPEDGAGNASVACGACAAAVSPQTVQTFVRLRKQVAEAVFENRGAHPEPDVLAQDFHADMKDVFHPCDKLYVDVLEMLLERKMQSQDWESCVDICKELVQPYKKFYPDYDVNTGLLYCKLGKLSNCLGRLFDAEDFLDEADKILAVTHGKSHSLYRKQVSALRAEVAADIAIASSPTAAREVRRQLGEAGAAAAAEAERKHAAAGAAAAAAAAAHQTHQPSG